MEQLVLHQTDDLEGAFRSRLDHDKETFRSLVELFDFSTDINPLSLPTKIWGNVYWEFMNPQQRDRILSSLFRFTLQRGMKKMPIYQKSASYSTIQPHNIHSLRDLCSLPVLLKDGDGAAGVTGFRSSIRNDPHVLRPTDITSSVPYDSGGTKGVPTPTHITYTDMQIEAQALAFRCFLPGGFTKGASLYNFYNPTHKGGRLIEEAARLIGKNHILTKRPEDDLDACIGKIKAYKTDIIAAVQPPLTPDANGAQSKKGGGVSFINLIGSDHSLFGRKNIGSIVQRAFVTGFQLPEPLIELAKEMDIDLFTTWGASEALPGATSTVLGPKTRTCQYNNQHLIMGPHLLSVVRFENGALVPAKVGETGVVLVTTIAREGTLFFNYAIGDKATVIADCCDCGRTTPIIGDIKRVDDPREMIDGGCRYC